MAGNTLTEFQRAVLGLFFRLPVSEGFMLAGGAGLVATGLSTRPAYDLDLFGADLATGITPAGNALETTCIGRGWSVERIRDSATFQRLVVRRSDEQLLVGLAIDSPPLSAPTMTTVDPTYPVAELAARNVLSLAVIGQGLDTGGESCLATLELEVPDNADPRRARQEGSTALHRSQRPQKRDGKAVRTGTGRGRCYR